MDPIQRGVYDSFRVLRNCIASSTGIASNLLLCDELLKARQMVRFPMSPMNNDPLLKYYRADSKGLGRAKEKDESLPCRSYTVCIGI